MKAIIYKVFYLFLLIYFPNIISAQSQTVISAEERRELEKKFQGLKTFYIDDDGTVVYRHNETSSNEKEEQTAPNKNTQSRVKVKVNINEDGEYVITTEQPDYTFSDSESKLNAIPENIQIKDDFEKQKTNDNFKEESKNISNLTETNNTTEDQPNKKASTRRESSYKSLEEAALDLEDLINEYKRAQSQTRRGGNSLSKKLSGGVDSSIRKDYTQSFTDEDSVLEEDNNSSYGSEPTYYINGVKVEASEYKKLKPEEIRIKERRASKANPNGEWWVQTK